jgi:hypothetical protein
MQCIELHAAIRMTVDFPHRFLRLTGFTLNFVKDNSHWHSCYKIEIVPLNFHKITSINYRVSFVLHCFRRNRRHTYEITMLRVCVSVCFLGSPVELLTQADKF